MSPLKTKSAARTAIAAVAGLTAVATASAATLKNHPAPVAQETATAAAPVAAHPAVLTGKAAPANRNCIRGHLSHGHC